MYTLGVEKIYDPYIIQRDSGEIPEFAKAAGGIGFKELDEARRWQKKVNELPNEFGFYAVYELDGDCEMGTGYSDKHGEYPSITKNMEILRKLS